MRHLSVGQKVTISIATPVLISFAVIILLSARQQASDMKQMFDHAQIEITELMAGQMSAAVKFKQNAAIEAAFIRQARSSQSSLASLRVWDDAGQKITEFASETLPHVALAVPGEQGSRMRDCNPIRGPALKKPVPAKPRFYRPISNWSEQIAVQK